MAVDQILSSARGLISSMHHAWDEASLVVRTAAVATLVITVTATIYVRRPRPVPPVKKEVIFKEKQGKDGASLVVRTAAVAAPVITETATSYVRPPRPVPPVKKEVIPKEKQEKDEGAQGKPIKAEIADGQMRITSVDWKALEIEEDDFSSDDEEMEWVDWKALEIEEDDFSSDNEEVEWVDWKALEIEEDDFSKREEAACLMFQKELSIERARKFSDVLCRGIGECAFSDLIYREGAVDEYVGYLEKLAAALMCCFGGYWGNNPGKFNTAIRQVRNAAEPILKVLREESRSKKKPDLTPTDRRSYSEKFNEVNGQLEGVAELVCLVECSEGNEPQLLSMARVEHKKLVENRFHSLMRNVEFNLSSLKRRVEKWERGYPVFAPLSKLVKSCLEVAKKPEVKSINSLLKQFIEFDSSEVSNAIKALDGLPERSVELAQQLAGIAGALASYTSTLEKKVIPEKERGVVEGGGWTETALGALETLLHGMLKLRSKKGTFYGLIPAARTIIQPLVYRFVIGPAIDKKIKKLAEADERFASLPLDAVKKTADELYNLSKELLTIFFNSIYDNSDHPIFDLGWNNLSELVEAAKHDDGAFFSEKALEAVELLHKGGKEQGLAHVVNALRVVREKIIAGDVPEYTELREAEEGSDADALSKCQKKFQLAFLPWVLNEFADQLTAEK